ncbi:MAG: putative DNA binding domain-containing protein [Gammaproteobacteria bacterium]|nr:putative DNA binding domain-containing protein [Gammaproteobacteria bacterium]
MAETITSDQRDAILSIEESYFADLKSREIKPSKLSETVSALCNAAGGEIFIGIREQKTKAGKVRIWQGFDDEEAANAILQVLNDIAPLADFIEIAFLCCDEEDGHVLKIEIKKNQAITNATDGKAYIRKGAQNLPVDTAEALERLRLDKGVHSYEDYRVESDLDEIENSTVTLEFLLNVIPTAEPEDWLRKQRLIKDAHPTVAGVLLFSEEPQALLPKRSAIKIFRYNTTDLMPTREQLAFDPLTIEGPAYALIYEAVRATQDIIEDMKALGREGLSEVEYPPETLHEIITNAVLHRDYSIAADVQIRIFDNRVEVESPGKLAGHVTPANILESQYARNQRIVRLINKFPNPPNKDVGEGLNTAFDAMRKLRLREPEITEGESSVIVLIPHQKLASPEDLVMEYLDENDEINNSTARRICGIPSENTMKRVFKRLEAKGLLEQVPDRPRALSAWRRTK